MACTGAFATVDEYAALFKCGDTLTAEQEAVIEVLLAIAASDIHAAMASSGQCDCTLAPWAAVYLSKLNIIDAVAIHNCTCGGANLTQEAKQMYLNWVTEQLVAIREGKLELCSGETGVDFPAMGWAEVNWNDAVGSEIYWNRQIRSS